MFLIFFLIPSGVILFFLLNTFCFFLRLVVSSIACIIDFVLISAYIGIVLAFLVPEAYDYFVGLTMQTKNILLAKEEQKLTTLANSYKKKINTRKEEIKALDKSISKISDIYNRKFGQLKNVYDKKFNYKLKSEQIALITEVLKKFDIKSRFIKITDSRYNIEVESKDDKEITQFIKTLVSKFNKDISIVDIDNIKFDESDKLYKGVIYIDFTKG